MITLWHNPRCSKSRSALALLEEQGASLTVRAYLKDAPTYEEIAEVLQKLELHPAQMMRTGDALFKTLGLSAEDTPETLLRAMSDHPALIERPIAITETGAVVGRPPEAVLSLVK